MQKLFFYFFLCLSTNLYAQKCGEEFVQELAKTFPSKNRHFDKIAMKVMKKNHITDYQSINIPILFVKKNAVLSWEKISIDKKDLLCHLNTKRIEYDESYIYSGSDTAFFIGIVHRTPTINGTKYQFFDVNSSHVHHFQRLIEKIRELTPDLIFSIYNVPDTYWFIKNNTLFVLSINMERMDIKEILIYNAENYINEYMYGNKLLPYYKRVEIFGN